MDITNWHLAVPKIQSVGLSSGPKGNSKIYFQDERILEPIQYADGQFLIPKSFTVCGFTKTADGKMKAVEIYVTGSKATISHNPDDNSITLQTGGGTTHTLTKPDLMQLIKAPINEVPFQSTLDALKAVYQKAAEDGKPVPYKLSDETRESIFAQHIIPQLTSICPSPAHAPKVTPAELQAAP